MITRGKNKWVQPLGRVPIIRHRHFRLGDTCCRWLELEARGVDEDWAIPAYVFEEHDIGAAMRLLESNRSSRPNFMNRNAPR